MFRRLYALICLVSAFSSAKAQDGNIVPAHFDQFFNNYYLLNPANEDSASSLRLRVGNRSLTGVFQGVNRIYFDADAGLRTKRKDRFHSIGIQAFNSREGEFFSKSRLYGRYSWRTGLTANSALSAGVSFGIVNYAFRSSQASAGGSSSVADGNTGVWYLRRRWNLGVSMQQIFEQQLQPINQIFILNRYYNFNLTNFFPLGPHLDLTTHLYSRYQKGEPLNIEFASIVEIQRRVNAGFNYRHDRGIVFLAGISRISFGSLNMALMASYMASMKKVNRVTDSVLEFHISLKK